MTWYFNPSSDHSTIDIYDHNENNVLTIDNPDAPVLDYDGQGILIQPDLRDVIIGELINRGQVDIYAIRAIAEALTGANFEEGTPG